jgi:hypothetical protein
MSPMPAQQPSVKLVCVALFNRQSMSTTLCIRCLDRYASPSSSYCAHCGFVVRAEVAAGLQRLTRYLESWAAFDAWCLAHGKVVGG